MYYLGIDPGKSGGMAWIGQRKIGILEMPDSLSDLQDAVSDISLANVFAVLEKVWSSPQMGVVSSFTFGRGYGRLEALLIAAKIPYDEVTPQTWQKTLGIPKRKKSESQLQFKKGLRARAQALFPKHEVWEMTKKIQMAVCDAMLIAEYCRRMHK